MNNDLAIEEIRHPLPNFTSETAIQKIRKAEDAWNTQNPEVVATAYSLDSRWRNRDIFIQGRHIHCKRVLIPIRKYRNGPIMCDIVLLSILLINGTLTIQHTQCLL